MAREFIVQDIENNQYKVTTESLLFKGLTGNHTVFTYSIICNGEVLSRKNVDEYISNISGKIYWKIS